MFKIRHYPSIFFLEYESTGPESTPDKPVRIRCFQKPKALFQNILQQAVNSFFLRAANCRNKIFTVIFLLQIAGRKKVQKISSCNLQGTISGYF